MTPMKCRTWDGEKMRYLTTSIITAHSIGLCAGEDFYVDVNINDHESNVNVMWFTGHSTMEAKEVYDGDYLRFPGQQEIYEVKWDQKEGAWTITYKGMTAFKIGMTWFMELAGNRYEGVKDKSKEAYA